MLLYHAQEHTEFAEAKLQKRIIERTLEDPELDLLAVMAVAGVAAEGRVHEEIMGQTADLTDLQRLMLRYGFAGLQCTVLLHV